MSYSPRPPVGNGDGAGSKGVSRLPTCEYCLDRAEYCGQTAFKRESYMCARHFRQHGRGLGNGIGFRLVVTPESPRRP